MIPPREFIHLLGSSLIVTGWLKTCKFLINPKAALGLTVDCRSTHPHSGAQFPEQRVGSAETRHAKQPATDEPAVCPSLAHKQWPAGCARRAQDSGRAGR